MLNYWVKNNKTTTDPIKTVIANTNTEDNSTAERWIYQNNSSNIPVIHYKISGGKHRWPGAAFDRPGTNKDFNASAVIWEFFSQFDVDGFISND